MKIGSFEFNLRELAGSMGDFGTLFPLAIGYIVVCGLNPAGFLVMMGLTNIALALIYRLPMPLEPKKVVAVVAISQKWPPSRVYASSLGLGILWLILATSGLIDRIVKITPKCVIRGIQLALGITLALTGCKMIRPEWSLGLISIAIVLLLRNNRKAPAAIVLMLLGLCIVAYRGELLCRVHLGFSRPPLVVPSLGDIWQAMILAGIAQIPLSITNAVIAAAALIREYFPDKAVSERKLMLNMGVMNVIVPFFGGMPMCHGAGGLTGQYYFGARTGGAGILEGLIEIGLGLFLATSIADLLAVFPMSIVGAMMFLVGIELTKFVRDVRGKLGMAVMALTVVASLVTNMAVGFCAGVIAFHVIIKMRHGGEQEEGGGHVGVPGRDL